VWAAAQTSTTIYRDSDSRRYSRHLSLCSCLWHYVLTSAVIRQVSMVVGRYVGYDISGVQPVPHSTRKDTFAAEKLRVQDMYKPR